MCCPLECFACYHQKKLCWYLKLSSKHLCFLRPLNSEWHEWMAATSELQIKYQKTERQHGLGPNYGDSGVPVLAGQRLCLPWFLICVFRSSTGSSTGWGGSCPPPVCLPSMHKEVPVVGDGFVQWAQHHAFAKAAGAMNGSHTRITN